LRLGQTIKEEKVASDGVERLRAAYEAFKSQDIPTVMAAFDEQIEWVVPDSIPFGGTFHGHEGVGQFFGQLPQYFQELHVDPEEFIDAGDVVVVPVHLHGTGSGGSLESKSLHLWRMRDGKAVSFQEYPDTAVSVQSLVR
jgi:ketosteroid isomerase-like protein